MIRVVPPIAETALASRPELQADAGFGALRTERGCLPLVALDVLARVAGLTSRVRVRQTFRNATSEPLEATYIFPLPDRAGVTSFRLQVGDRVVEGELKERARARAEYQKAIESGHRAAIAEEERSGTFSLRVGNLPAGEEASVELTLVGPVPVSGGEATFRFPLVVAPRYVPGIALDGPSVGAGWASDTEEVPDASRVTPPVLLPGFSNPVRLSLVVEIDPAGLDAADGNWADRIQSSLHSVITTEGPPWTVCLQPGERLNRDFILRFPVTSEAVQTALLAAAGEGEPGHFALTVVPPAMEDENRPTPRDVVVVLDRSGSMAGWKMVAARRAVGRLIDTLLDHDRFTVLAFDHATEEPPHAQAGLTEATDRARWRTLEWLARIEARGGTEMSGALEKALQCLSRVDPTRERLLVLVTDGQVAGEDAVLRAVSDLGGKAVPRIHTVGIDRAVNAGFLRRLADLGGGSCDLVESEDRLDAAMEQIDRAIGSPALTGLQIEPIGLTWDPEALTPSRLPDLFADRPVTIHGRFQGEASSFRVRLRGMDARGKPWEQQVSARPGPAEALRAQWGRAKVRELEDRYAAGRAKDPEALARHIVEVSLCSRVLSRFTAYVAVDRAEVVNEGGRQQRIVQPVEAPDGWDMLAEADGMARAVCLMSAGADEALFRRRRTGGRMLAMALPLPGRRTLEDVVAEIAGLIERIEKPRTWLRTRRAKLARLAGLLEELADLLRVAGHARSDPAPRAVEQLARDARAALLDDRQGNSEALAPDRLKSFFDKVRQALDLRAPPPGPKAGRERFWT